MKVSTLPPKDAALLTDEIILSADSSTNLITIENLQKLIGGGGGSGSGADIRSGDQFSEYATTSDTTSSSGKVYSSTTSVSGDICTLTFDSLQFGMYSIIIRTRCASTSAGNLYTVKAHAGDTELMTRTVKATDFHTAEKWLCLGMGVDFSGQTGDIFKVTITPEESPGAEYAIDYVQVSPAPVAVNAI